MNIRKLPRTVVAFIAAGLLMSTSPVWLKDIGIPIPDFLRGAIAGVGIGLEMTGFILQRKYRNSTCRFRTEEMQ